MIMKRSSVFVLALAAATSAFAYYGSRGSSDFELPAWFKIMCFIMIGWGVLNIILFFKVWGMTNNVSKIRRKYESDYSADDILSNARRLFLQGKKAEVRDMYINSFCAEVEAYYERKKNNDVMKPEMLMQLSITVFVNALEKRLSNIGEPMPEVIRNMKTMSDYYNSITFEKVSSEEVAASNEDKSPELSKEEK